MIKGFLAFRVLGGYLYDSSLSKCHSPLWKIIPFPCDIAAILNPEPRKNPSQQSSIKRNGRPLQETTLPW
jgi:hypothetical protein